MALHWFFISLLAKSLMIVCIVDPVALCLVSAKLKTEALQGKKKKNKNANKTRWRQQQNLWKPANDNKLARILLSSSWEPWWQCHQMKTSSEHNKNKDQGKKSQKPGKELHIRIAGWQELHGVSKDYRCWPCGWCCYSALWILLDSTLYWLSTLWLFSCGTCASVCV